MPLLALLFLVVPVVEIYVLIQVGHVIGAGWTVLLLLADAVLGAWLVRREGRRAWRRFSDAVASGRPPATQAVDGAIVLVGGTLLVAPGFVTDLAGIVCLLPVTRPLVRRLLARWAVRRLGRTAPGIPLAGWGRRPRGTVTFDGAPRESGARPASRPTPSRASTDRVVEGAVVQPPRPDR